MFKPMLASVLTKPENLQFPVFVSPKLDGIRCIVKDGEVLSRKLKPIPNKFIREQVIAQSKGYNLDGELMLRNRSSNFNEVQSAVMSEDGEPDFVYWVFDVITAGSYKDRWNEGDMEFFEENVKELDIRKASTIEELMQLEEVYVNKGYEGLMIRNPDGPYKYGRSTEKQAYLLKLKRFADAEGTVMGFYERMHNGNEATKDAIGHTKRSTAKDGMAPMNTLGALIVMSQDHGQFHIGTGFTDAERKEIWDNQKVYLGKSVTYKYQELSVYGIPRFPVFKAFREDI